MLTVPSTRLHNVTSTGNWGLDFLSGYWMQPSNWSKCNGRCLCWLLSTRTHSAFILNQQAERNMYKGCVVWWRECCWRCSILGVSGRGCVMEWGEWDVCERVEVWQGVGVKMCWGESVMRWELVGGWQWHQYHVSVMGWEGRVMSWGARDSLSNSYPWLCSES